VVDVEHDHLGRAAGGAAGLDGAGGRVGAAHERDRADAVPPEEQQLLGRADAGEVEAGAGAALEDQPSSLYQLRIESIESSTARMKHALTACGDVVPTLNQTGEL
jgi:hypothetical protein